VTSIRAIVLRHLAVNDMSRRSLALKMSSKGHCHEQTVYRWLRGDRDISSSLACNILDELGIPILIR
jgi:hypothetical protein